MNENFEFIANLITTVTFCIGIIAYIKSKWDDFFPIRLVHFVPTPLADTESLMNSINLGNQVTFSLFIETKRKADVRIDLVAPIVYHGLKSEHYLRLIDPNTRINFTMQFSDLGLCSDNCTLLVKENRFIKDFNVESSIHKRVFNKFIFNESFWIRRFRTKEICGTIDVPVSLYPMIRCEISSRGIKSKYIIFAHLNDSVVS